MPFSLGCIDAMHNAPTPSAMHLNINLSILINLKYFRSKKSQLTMKIRHQQAESGCSHACAGTNVTAGFVSFAPELLCVARSPLTQCLRIQGCFCTSVSGMRFSGSRTSNFRQKQVSMCIHSSSMSLGIETYLLNQILSLWTHELRHRHLSPRYPSLSHDGCILKRRFPNQEFVRQNA